MGKEPQVGRSQEMKPVAHRKNDGPSLKSAEELLMGFKQEGAINGFVFLQITWEAG